MRTKVGEPVPEPSIAWEFRTGEDAVPHKIICLAGVDARRRYINCAYPGYQLCLSWAGWIRRQGRRPWGQLLGIRLDCFHDFLYRAIQLRIFAAYHLLGPVLDNDIRLNASIFHYPLALIVITRKLRPRNVAAIHQIDLAPNAANPAPSTLANEWTELVILEHVTEDVAVRGSVMVGQADHRSVKHVWWHGAALEITR